MNKLKQNLGSHPNDRTLKELRMKIDRTKIDVLMMSNQRMTSQWWETEGSNKEHRQKLRWSHNNEKPKKQLTNLRQNLGWHPNYRKPK